jgi:hypothetical protein
LRVHVVSREGGHFFSKQLRSLTARPRCHL